MHVTMKEVKEDKEDSVDVEEVADEMEKDIEEDNRSGLTTLYTTTESTLPNYQLCPVRFFARAYTHLLRTGGEVCVPLKGEKKMGKRFERRLTWKPWMEDESK